MALPTSGTISLADIQAEFGGSTAPISLGNYYAGGANVPAGITGTNGAVPASGTLGLYHFYGTSKVVDPTVGVYYLDSRVTRLNASGALLGTTTSVGTYRNGSGGAKCGTNAAFYGGEIYDPEGYGYSHQQLTRITTAGALAAAEVLLGTARSWLAGAECGGASMFYGGYTDTSPTSNRVTRISTTGALIGSETSIGTARCYLGGSIVGTNALFYGGGGGTTNTNRVTLINSTGALVQTETTVGTARQNPAGAPVGANALFYAGFSTARTNVCTRLGATGAIVGSETAVGTARHVHGGARIGANGIFQGGFTTTSVATRTMIDANGAIVGTEAAVGTAQANVAGAGI